MKRVAIIQARTGSTRLPRKVLMDLEGEPMLTRVIRRVQRATCVEHIVIATTDHGDDDAVAALGRTLGVEVFRGSEDDVLSRYVGASRAAGADLIVRVTADCPLLDPEVIDSVVGTLERGAGEGPVDYASNVIDRTYPRGLDVEALFRDTLERVGRMARSSMAREHVTYFILHEQPSLFRMRSVVDTIDNSDLRWTVDEPADLEMVRSLYDNLNLATSHVSYRDVVAWIRHHPDVASMNAHIQQKA